MNKKNMKYNTDKGVQHTTTILLRSNSEEAWLNRMLVGNFRGVVALLFIKLESNIYTCL